MRGGISESLKKLTAGALLSALGVSLLALGALFETLDLTMAALASFTCVFAVIEFGGGYPWLIYAVTGILSIVLMPYSMAGWFYLLFFGYYPILKDKLERLRKPISWIFKILVFNTSLFICAVAVDFIFLGMKVSVFEAMSYMLGDLGKFAALIYVMLNLVFVIYDIALTRLIGFYYAKLRDRFRFLRK